MPSRFSDRPQNRWNPVSQGNLFELPAPNSSLTTNFLCLLPRTPCAPYTQSQDTHDLFVAFHVGCMSLESQSFSRGDGRHLWQRLHLRLLLNGQRYQILAPGALYSTCLLAPRQYPPTPHNPRTTDTIRYQPDYPHIMYRKSPLCTLRCIDGTVALPRH
ncbi:uncharacterized protein EI90DRAFT_171000 [Cantharellus anzutake]|uniref:uncharacterized protein n=1 Tax=Cantharellus anzutake TaxID=1750568 RepID=UPI0019089253|nr:uncharacterized protein EI90DRAFT_171000 [Cantharellus anzutake]KAF8336389.1 hypothetical protein EI90DRAFT_171000 [Cantharellus anzutake]